MTTTYLTLKQQAVQGYRARQMVTGTVPTNGTTTVIPDNSRQEPQGEWDRVDSFIKFTAGTNVGTERRVTGFSAGVSLTVAPALSASVGSGSSYQIFKTFSDGDVGLAVNEALRDMFPERIIESIASAGETQDVWNFQVPTAAGNLNTELFKVDRAVGSTGYNYTTLTEGADYTIDENAGFLTFVQMYPGASGAYVRFHYRKPSGELSSDSDTTDEPVSLILAGARKWMALAEGDRDAIERFGREFENAKSDYQKSRQSKQTKVPTIRVYGTSW